VLVDATATDDAGIASVDCTPIYGETSSDATSSSGTVSVSDEGTTVVSCTATDNKGNTSEAVTAAVQIDTVAPSITDDGMVAGTLGDNGWYVSPVTNQFSADDSTSGLADCAMTFTKSTGASEEGSAVVVSSGACSDLAGNANPGIDSAAFMIDMSAPNPPDAHVDPAPNAAGWNNSVPVTVSFTDNGDNGPSGVAACTADQPFTVETTASGETVDGTCTDFAGNVSDPTSVTVKIDLTDPTITFQSRTTANGFGWNNGPVTVEWSCFDALSGAVDATVMQTVSGEGENQSATRTCYDVADNSASDTANDIDIDLTKPSVGVTGVADGAVYVLGSVPTPGCDTTDALSGVATPASLSVTGGPVGFVTAACDGAQDKAGNPGDPASATYQVVYDFNGFFRPIDNSTPSYIVLNVTKAGSSIPSKFSLDGYQGLGILAAGSPSSKQVACGAADSTDVIEQTMTAGNSTLTYDGVVDQYVYVWKSDKLWAGTCRRLDVALVDGTTHSAFFKFTK